jgi:hypothetical protein
MGSVGARAIVAQRPGVLTQRPLVKVGQPAIPAASLARAAAAAARAHQLCTVLSTYIVQGLFRVMT